MTRVVLGTLVLLTACAPRPGEDGPTSGPDPETQRQIDVYVAVLSELFGDGLDEGTGPPTYILDRADPKAADPGATEGGEPIPPGVQQGVLQAFPGSDLRFIGDGDEVTISLEEGTGGGVEGGGSLITLGPVPPGEERVEVAAGSYCGGLCGMWATYVVERQTSTWKVTGTTGPVALS